MIEAYEPPRPRDYYRENPGAPRPHYGEYVERPSYTEPPRYVERLTYVPPYLERSPYAAPYVERPTYVEHPPYAAPYAEPPARVPYMLDPRYQELVRFTERSKADPPRPLYMEERVAPPPRSTLVQKHISDSEYNGRTRLLLRQIHNKISDEPIESDMTTVELFNKVYRLSTTKAKPEDRPTTSPMLKASSLEWDPLHNEIVPVMLRNMYCFLTGHIFHGPMKVHQLLGSILLRLS
jgi:hypothetical protein